jgi:DNA primase
VARIPDGEIERLKREVSLERLVEAQGIELKRHGADLLGLCPFHDDKAPSLVVSPKKNLWHCLGACQTGGSVIDWVMRRDGLSFRHAVDVLRGDTLPAAAVVVKAPLPVAEIAEDRELLSQVVAYYHETLKQSPEALAYLEQRGLRSHEAIERFRLGFANRTLGYRLPTNGTKAGLGARERLQRLGVLRESGHEHLNGSLIVPVFGEEGEVLGMYGRKVTPESKLRKGTPLHLYLPGPHRGVFNLAALQASRTVILCEALLDALTFWCAGYRNVTASYGVEGFTADHLEAFKKYEIERVLIAYDRDDAGERASMALAERLQGQGIECFRVQFPKGMDANEYACKVQPGEKSLGVLLRNAVWLGKGKPPAVDLGALTCAVELLPPVVSTANGLTPRQEAAAAPHKPEERRPAPVSPSPATPAPFLASVEPPGALPLAAKEELHRPAAGAATATADAAEASPAADELVIEFGDRRYRVRGLQKNLSHDALRVNVLASRGDRVHVDTLDIYSARQRAAFVKQAAAELESHEDTVKRDLGQLLLKLEAAQDELIKQALEPKTRDVKLSDDEQATALELLRDPQLLERILHDFEACGIVGEETNKLLGYLAAVSRKLEEPLAVVVQSSSAAGKTSLMEAVLAFMPDEERVKYSAMTGQSLFYMGETNLKHKILAIVEEQGAERASYALKLLQSEGELTIASTGKDPQTGKLVTHEYRVEGPVMIFLTTTAVEIDEELLNRCLVLTVDEDREQTRAIHRLQREKQTLEGLLARRARPTLLKVHQDAQRMLKPILVANPYARHLTFLDDRTRTRRDHVKYLTLIRAIALLHQYQRPILSVEHGGVVVPYVEVTRQDVALANRLAHQVLGRSLDELAPQTRRLLVALDRMVKDECRVKKVERAEFRFTRRQVRERLGFGNTQLKVHLARLEEMEYVLVHRDGPSASYELLYEGQGQDGQPFVCGLLDVEKLSAYDGERSAFSPDRSGVGRPPVGAWSGGGRGERIAVSPTTGAALVRSEPETGENALLGETSEIRRRTQDSSNGNGNGRAAELGTLAAGR